MSEPAANAESIFLTALERDSSRSRRAWLDEACGDDAELRARVERLLRAHDDAGSFLEKPPAEVDREPTRTRRLGTGEPRSEHEPRTDVESLWADDLSLDFLTPCETPGRLGKIGPYEVIEVVGRGGLGIVLQAFDPKLGRIVAVKVPAPEFAANTTARKRFLREAQAAAAVSHPHVVTIHAVDEGRLPYLVMEYIDGRSLQQKIDQQGPLRLKEILRIGMQIASGLSAAHAQGLIHRDIKPSNILLENGVERVKLTDFGLARATDDVGITRTGEVTGTPQYMSPEQAQGEPVDHRSDLFSLGSVLYAMCTGRSPFRADSVLAVLRRVCEEEPRPIEEINPDAPDWLREIIAKLMAKRPADRFQSAQELADILGRHLAHVQHPATAEQPGPLGFWTENETRVASPTEGEVSRKVGWTKLVPAAAWIPAALFALLYSIALLDVQRALPGPIAEALGVLCYLIAVAYLLLWWSSNLIRFWFRGPRPRARTEYEPWRVVMFFTLMGFFSGLFVVGWAPEAGERLGKLRDLLRTPQSSLVTFRVDDPTVTIEIEGPAGTVKAWDDNSFDPYGLKDEYLLFAVGDPGRYRWSAFKDGELIDTGSFTALPGERLEIDVTDRRNLLNSEAPTPPAADAPPDAANAAELDRLVELAEQRFERLKAAVAEGTITESSLTEPEIELLESRIRRAEAHGDDAEIVDHLTRIVELRRQHLERLESFAKTGIIPQQTVDETEITLLEALSRLAAARDRQNEVVEHLQRVVELRRQEFERVESFVETGVVPASTLNETEKLLLEAQFRLKQAQEETDQADSMNEP